MAHAYIIEVGEEAAGIVVRESGETGQRRGYRFYASRRKFLALEGRIFSNPEQARKSAVNLRDESHAIGSVVTPLVLVDACRVTTTRGADARPLALAC